MKKLINEIVSRKEYKISKKEKILWASIFVSGLYLMTSILIEHFKPYIQSIILAINNN